MKSTRQMVSLLVMVLAILVTSQAHAALQSEVLRYVNAERAAAGLTPLALDAGLCEAASVRASEASIYFGHMRPDGTNVESVLNGGYTWFGENLAFGQPCSAQQLVMAWMCSPTHRANILDARFTKLGIACVKGEDGNYFWAQIFTDATPY